MMKKCSWKLKRFWKKNKVQAAAILLLLLINGTGYAQDGVAGINEANQKVRSYFDAGTELMYAVGAILGLIGAVKVYQKWNAGDPDTGKVAAAWFGSCVFLVVVATVIKSFFGV
jgi:phage-related protein